MKRRLFIILTSLCFYGSAPSCMRPKIAAGAKLPGAWDILEALNELKTVKERSSGFLLSGSGGDTEYFGNLYTSKPVGEIELHELKMQIREQLVSLTPIGYSCVYRTHFPREEISYVDKKRNQLTIDYVAILDDSRILNITFRIHFYSPEQDGW